MRIAVGPGDGAKEGVVAVRTLPFPVEARCGSFGMASGTRHRPAVIERHSRKPLTRQALHDQTSRFTPHLGDTFFIRGGKRTTDRGYVRESLRTGNTPDHPVIPVGVHIAQPPMSDDRVHDRQHHDNVMVVNGIGPQMAEASPRPFPDAEEGEEVPEDDGSRI